MNADWEDGHLAGFECGFTEGEYVGRASALTSILEQLKNSVCLSDVCCREYFITLVEAELEKLE